MKYNYSTKRREKKKRDLGLLKTTADQILYCVWITKYFFLANRLKCYLDLLLQNDQMYCIPKRPIVDHLYFH